MAIARAHGKPPKLSPAQTREVHRMHASGDYAIAQIAELFSFSRPTIYRALQRTTDGRNCPLTPGHSSTWRNTMGLSHERLCRTSGGNRKCSGGAARLLKVLLVLWPRSSTC